MTVGAAIGELSVSSSRNRDNRGIQWLRLLLGAGRALGAPLTQCFCDCCLYVTQPAILGDLLMRDAMDVKLKRDV